MSHFFFLPLLSSALSFKVDAALSTQTLLSKLNAEPQWGSPASCPFLCYSNNRKCHEPPGAHTKSSHVIWKWHLCRNALLIYYSIWQMRIQTENWCIYVFSWFSHSLHRNTHRANVYTPKCVRLKRISLQVHAYRTTVVCPEELSFTLGRLL